MTRARAWQLRMRAQARCQRCGKSLGWRSVRYCHPCLDKFNDGQRAWRRRRAKARRAKAWLLASVLLRLR